MDKNDIGASASSALCEAGREILLEPCIGSSAVFGLVIRIGSISYGRTGERNIGIELAVLHVIVGQAIPIGLVNQSKSTVNSRIMSTVTCRNPTLESRDGVANDAQALCCLGLDIGIGGKALDGREPVSSCNPCRAVSSGLQLGEQGSVGKLGGGKGLIAALGSLPFVRTDLQHSLIPEAVTHSGGLGAAGIDSAVEASAINIGHSLATVEDADRSNGGIAVLIDSVASAVLVSAYAANRAAVAH